MGADNLIAEKSGVTAAPTGQPSTNRRVFNLAWPVNSENFLQMMLGIVDTLLVARLGVTAIAGVGSSVLVAQAAGARKFEIKKNP